jgi:aspartate/tyrosine/aromatic aminotransferase
MLSRLPPFSPDPILALIDLYAADSRKRKIDMGVGVYKDAAGCTPIIHSVKLAEIALQKSQMTKTYLGSGGNSEFCALVKSLILGEELEQSIGHNAVAFQTVGGTGAIRLAAEVIAKASPQGRIWIGTPSWPNHFSIFHDAGLQIKKYIYCQPPLQVIELRQVIAAAKQAQVGDGFLIHACCHNPTGIDLSHDDSRALLDVLRNRGVLPIVDCAYAGFSQNFEDDIHIVRAVMKEFDEAIVCFSCSKNFGLYRERIGLILVKAKEHHIANTKLGLASIARSSYSQPPDHGAAIVTGILKSRELYAQWREELAEMCSAINRKRQRLASYRINTDVVKNLSLQHGMFSLLPLDQKACLTLRSEFGIYMTEDARINVLGVSDEMEPYFVESLSRVLGRSTTE